MLVRYRTHHLDLFICIGFAAPIALTAQVRLVRVNATNEVLIGAIALEIVLFAFFALSWAHGEVLTALNRAQIFNFFCFFPIELGASDKRALALLSFEVVRLDGVAILI